MRSSKLKNNGSRWRNSKLINKDRFFFRSRSEVTKKMRARKKPLRKAFKSPAMQRLKETFKNKNIKLNLSTLQRLPKKFTNYLYVTFFYGKLRRIFDFFYNNYVTRQEYRMRSRRRYIYRVDIIQRRVFKKKIKKRFVSLRLVKLFYLTLQYHQFRQLARRTRLLDGCYEHNFFLALEGRLVSFVYRTSFIPNIFQCIQLVRRGGVVVEKSVQNYVNYHVTINRVVRFTSLVKRLIYISLLYRLGRQLVLFNPPRYIFVSYYFLYCYMKRPPRRRDLVFPISLDMYRATGYAF
jgi:ribosomal protein S4